jgi:hypothetical protein
MTTSPFRMNPSLGPDLHQVVLNDGAWYEGAGRGAAGAGQAMSPQTGDTAFGDDGREYMWVEVAGSTISPHASNETQVSLTINAVGSDPRVTIATGSGGWYLMPQSKNGGVTSIPAGGRTWVAKGTAP